LYLQLGWLGSRPGQHDGIGALAREHLSLVLIARVPLAALLSLLLFRRAGYNYAEHLVLRFTAAGDAAASMSL
jgi:hypothetical protein